MADREGDLAGVIQGIRRRAAFARTSALIIVGILIIIGVGTAFVFVQAVTGPTISIGAQSNLANALIQTGGLDWVSEMTKAFIRVAGVIMAVFIINILVSFARYNMRAANFLDSRADTLEITGNDVERLIVLLPAISIDPLDFLKTPMSPFDTYLETIRGLFPGRSGNAESRNKKSNTDG